MLGPQRAEGHGVMSGVRTRCNALDQWTSISLKMDSLVKPQSMPVILDTDLDSIFISKQSFIPRPVAFLQLLGAQRCLRVIIE